MPTSGPLSCKDLRSDKPTGGLSIIYQQLLHPWWMDSGWPTPSRGVALHPCYPSLLNRCCLCLCAMIPPALTERWPGAFQDAPLGSSSLAWAPLKIPHDSIKDKPSSLDGARFYHLLSSPRTWLGAEVSHGQPEWRLGDGVMGMCPSQPLVLTVQND